MPQNTELDIHAEIGRLREELRELLAVREEYLSKLNEVRDRIAQVINDVRNLKESLSSVRERIAAVRDSINELKKRRSEVRMQIKALIQELRSTTATLRKRAKLVNVDEIRKEIDSLEWKLITSPNLAPEEEKAIVNRIAELEHELNRLRSQLRIEAEPRDKKKKVNSFHLMLNLLRLFIFDLLL